MTSHQTLHIDGHSLAMVAFNPQQSGAPVILLHGITASVDFWSPDLLAPFLALGPCYALSLPGHYPAAFAPGFRAADLTTGRIVDLLAGAIRQIAGHMPVRLVGHSTGGYAALALAALRPEMVLNVTSISGFVHGRWTGILGLYQRLARMGQPGKWLFKSFFALAHQQRVFRATGRFYVADPARLTDYPDYDRLMQVNWASFRRLKLEDVFHYFQVMPDIDITPLLPQVCAPTLVIVGDKDPIVPPEQSQRVARMAPAAQLAVIAGAGHFPFFEYPNEYHHAIQAWNATRS